jgi:LmbE family N-acetylglucosaminyl deacetylase
LNVLAIGAHPDDVELGCGGALLAHRARGDSISLLTMTIGEHGPQADQSRVLEQTEAAKLLGARLFWGDFLDGAVPEGRAATVLIDAVIAEVEADVVYTHSPRDTHQDHRATSIASLAAGRRVSRVLMYEAPTSQDFVPSLYVDIGPFLEGKLSAIRAHDSQVLKNRLVDLEAVAAQARYRGFEARLHHGYAEAFAVARFVWDLAGSPPAEIPQLVLHAVTNEREA